MVISYYGEGCFKIQSADTAILVDAFNSESGLNSPRFKFDLEIKTLASVENIGAFKRDGFQIIGPGEYDVKGIKIFGFGLPKESSADFIKTVYIVEAEGMKLCFLGHISEIPQADIMEHLEEIDILFVSAGGKPFLEQKAAVQLVKKIGPKIIVPSFYKVPGLKRKAGDLKVFLEEGGYKDVEILDKLTVKKKELGEIKKMKVVSLKV